MRRLQLVAQRADARRKQQTDVQQQLAEHLRVLGYQPFIWLALQFEHQRVTFRDRIRGARRSGKQTHIAEHHARRERDQTPPEGSVVLGLPAR